MNTENRNAVHVHMHMVHVFMNFAEYLIYVTKYKNSFVEYVLKPKLAETHLVCVCVVAKLQH
jgi:hypothetical protein